MNIILCSGVYKFNYEHFGIFEISANKLCMFASPEVDAKIQMCICSSRIG